MRDGDVVSQPLPLFSVAQVYFAIVPSPQLVSINDSCPTLYFFSFSFYGFPSELVESIESIANHIMALYGAKIFAYTKNDNGLDINLERETEEGAVYIHTSRPGFSQLYGPQHERGNGEGFFFLSLSRFSL